MHKVPHLMCSIVDTAGKGLPSFVPGRVSCQPPAWIVERAVLDLDRLDHTASPGGVGGTFSDGAQDVLKPGHAPAETKQSMRMKMKLAIETTALEKKLANKKYRHTPTHTDRLC